jgi:hypothetical protein
MAERTNTFESLRERFMTETGKPLTNQHLPEFFRRVLDEGFKVVVERDGERWHFILRNGMFDFFPEHGE